MLYHCSKQLCGGLVFIKHCCLLVLYACSVSTQELSGMFLSDSAQISAIAVRSEHRSTSEISTTAFNSGSECGLGSSHRWALAIFFLSLVHVTV